VAQATSLDQYPLGEKTWVEYTGMRRGSFGVVGEFTKISYRINGPGHKVEVHSNDLSKFRRAGRGEEFRINVPPPADYVIPVPQEPEPFAAPEPVLAEIVQLDEIAMVRQNGA
jgi:hypothetical protein